jgi:type II secretory pathway pseudopilin PulG
MIRLSDKKLKNKGETIVEVMVAFIVLLIVLALFGSSIVATGNAERYANEKRTEADNAMKQLQDRLHGGDTSEVSSGAKKSTIVQSGNLAATRYVTQDGLVYWVFDNEE